MGVFLQLSGLNFCRNGIMGIHRIANGSLNTQHLFEGVFITMFDFKVMPLLPEGLGRLKKKMILAFFSSSADLHIPLKDLPLDLQTEQRVQKLHEHGQFHQA